VALALTIPAEGLKLTPYYDPPGILTVCYGHTGPDVVKGRRYSLDECRAMLNRDMLEALQTVERCAPGMPAYQLPAWGDTVYNVGPSIVCDTSKSTAARLLQSGQWGEACRQLPRWNKARVGGVMVELPGLTKRRAKALAVCEGRAL
jgi:GH24 family phage-related lysozyme (muramidase)